MRGTHTYHGWRTGTVPVPHVLPPAGEGHARQLDGYPYCPPCADYVGAVEAAVTFTSGGVDCTRCGRRTPARNMGMTRPRRY